MQIELGLVGLDMVLLVMGQELVSFKIVDTSLTTEIASKTACDGPCGSSAVIVALTVQDMSLRDMQVISYVVYTMVCVHSDHSACHEGP